MLGIGLTLLIIVLVEIFVLGMWYWYAEFQERKRIGINGPFPLPFIGNLHTVFFGFNSGYQQIHRNRRKYGNVFGYRLPFTERRIVILEPDLVDYMLKRNFVNYIKGPDFHEGFAELLGDGIFNVDGNKWKIERRLASHFFTGKQIQQMLPVFADHGREFISYLEQELHQRKTEQQQQQQQQKTKTTSEDKEKQILEFDFQSLFARLALNVISHVGFGIHLTSFQKKRGDKTEEETKKMKKLEEEDEGELLSPEEEEKFIESFNLCQRNVIFRFVLGTFLKLAPFRWFIPSEVIFNRNISVLNQVVHRIIERRRQLRLSEVNNRVDILSRYVALEQEMKEKGDQAEVTFSSEFLRDVVFNFLLAGRDTTSTTLSFLFYLLANHPEVQSQVREEICRVLGRSVPRQLEDQSQLPPLTGSESILVPSQAQLKELRFLRACINETLRLYPPVPTDPKQSVDEEVLPTGQIIPARSRVVWSAMGLGRHEGYWERADDFVPTRWSMAPRSDDADSSDSSNAKDKPPTTIDGVTVRDPDEEERKRTFIPFQAGPRICLGKAMAYAETEMLASMLLQKFSFHNETGFEAKLTPNMTLVSGNGIMLSIRALS